MQFPHLYSYILDNEQAQDGFSFPLPRLALKLLPGICAHTVYI
jgi:hypothetical protein